MPSTADSNDNSRNEADAATTPGPPRVFQSDEIFQGQRETWIEHSDVLYRLRITSAGKLILTK